MKNAKPTIRIRKTIAVLALAGAAVVPVTVIGAGPASAAPAGFENMPPA